ncbi:hypothetical protein [Thermaurantiacus tibetensis]|uniref:hypothetical protein n=1 Tax=Thermaurantiacus tibetensis TaxID=2759035 RepID=UPI00188FEE10|nr:hypothetical protein [Thermaurantiacus tibetensis]
MLPRFARFVAVDWSGARGARHRGIAVAVAEAGNGPPRLVPPPHRSGWARAEVADWLLGLPGPALAGFDFSFAPPFLDRGAYLSGLATPDTAPGFWAFVERHCEGDPDLGAHGFMEGVARPHFWMGAADGEKRAFLRWRRCEAAFNAGGGGKAATVFDCVGAAQVARASFAGMRLLHRLRGPYAVWPFDPPGPRTVVEIYTRAMLRHAGGRGLKLRDAPALAAALAAFGSEVPEGSFSDHETDALVAAAALRHLAGEARWWSPPGLAPDIAATEGWTFGVS